MTRLALLLVLCASAAPAQEVLLPATTEETLPNGLTVFAVEYDKVPLVHFRLVTRGGAARDAAGAEGRTAMMASLLRRGTASRSAPEIAAQIEATGGSLESAAGMDYCAVKCEAPSRDVDGALAVFADVVMHPVFAPGELTRERELRIAALEGLREDPATVASMTFRREAYGAHPYGRHTDGTRLSLAGLTRDQVAAAYRSLFVPGNCILVVVGPVERAGLMQKIRAAFGTWQATAPADTVAVPPVPPVRGTRVVLVNMPQATQTQIVSGATGAPLRHPDRMALNVGSAAFGGGFTSRLMRELRVKRSLTYGVAAGFSAHAAGGLFSVATFTKNGTVGEALEVIGEETRKFREGGATAAEMRTAANAIGGTFARALQSPDVLAALITDREIYGLPDDQIEGYLRRLHAVSVADVRRAAGGHFPAEQDRLTVLVGPADSLGATAGRFGTLVRKELDEVMP